MTALRLHDRQRLDVLSLVVLEVLDGRFSEGELESDAELSGLYNLASALAERHDAAAAGYDHGETADELTTLALRYSGTGTRLAAVRDRIAEEVIGQ